MTSSDFCYWLQGYLEVSNAESISKKELAIIKEHLNTVFTDATKNRFIGGFEYPESTYFPPPMTITYTNGSTDSNPLGSKREN